MNTRFNHEQVLQYAGLFTWGMVGLPLGYAWLEGVSENGSMETSLIGWVISFLAFGILYTLVSGKLNLYRRGRRDGLYLLFLTISAISVSYFSATGLGSVLLMVIAGILPWLLPLYFGIFWLVISHLIVIPVFIYGPEDLMWWEALMQSIIYAGFSSFVFATGYVAKLQASAREDQRRLNAELRATRTLLAENSRIGERVRISRELHDLLGHHLTALSLNLEVASHLTDGKANEHVRQSHSLAKLLLADVREAVSEMRHSGSIDILATLEPILSAAPQLQINFESDPILVLDDSATAQTILRCVQEILTNTLKHANAKKLDLSLHKLGNLLILKSQDDGIGVSLSKLGNGLQGMKERVTAVQGDLVIESRVGHGFGLTITIPLGDR